MRLPLRVGARRQLSLFGVEAAEPTPADLAGLLAGPGEVVRLGGTARVSVVVDAAWRVHVLVAELAVRNIPATWVPTAEGHLRVRTAYAAALAPLGSQWLHPAPPGTTQTPAAGQTRAAGQATAAGHTPAAGQTPAAGPGPARGSAVKRPPVGFHLSGPRLRLWAAAAGRPEPLGFVLRLGPSDQGCWEPVGAALAAVGLPAALLGPRSGGPAYRITGRRRLARLAELVGDRPLAAPRAGWPS